MTKRTGAKTNQFQAVEDDFAFFLEHTDEIAREIPLYRESLLALLPPAGARMMEYGPGTGSMLKNILSGPGLENLLPRLEAVLAEPSPAFREQCRLNLSGLGLKRLEIFPFVADYLETPDAEHSLDLILTNHVFYYVDVFPAEFALLLKALKPGGHIVGALGDPGHPLLKVYEANWDKWGVVKHRRHPSEILQAFRASGLNIETRLVSSALEFPDTPENRLKMHRFLLVESGGFDPESLAWMDDFKRGETIRFEQLDDFYVLKKSD